MRTVFVTTVAGIATIIVTALISFPLANHTAQRQAHEALGKQADLVAAMLVNVDSPEAHQRTVRLIRDTRAEVDLALVLGDGRPEVGSWLPADIARRVSRGEKVEVMVHRDGQDWLICGRPTKNGEGIVLAKRATSAPLQPILVRFGLVLVAGLATGIGAALVLARRLSRPLRRAAGVARRISAGDRQIRLPVEPPAELAELAHALNELASALSVSEGRQRDFLMSVSHELRTPLTTIRGYAEALSDGIVEGTTEASGVKLAGNTVRAEAERLERLVADLLVLARLEASDFPVEMLNIDLTGLANAAATAWAPRCADAGVELRVEVLEYSVVVHTDPTRLRQVIDGLMENALRVVPAGAPVVLAVRAEWDAMVIEVRDGGPGLSDADLAVAFDRGALFDRYRGVRKVGSGLGLALAWRLVRRLGGSLEAGHSPEGGARFTVRLPADTYRFAPTWPTPPVSSAQ